MFKEFFKTEELNEEQKHQENKDPIKVLRANRIKIKKQETYNIISVWRRKWIEKEMIV